MQTELHRHLDVSIRSSTLLRLAQERGWKSGNTSLETFRDHLILRKPLSNLQSVLSQFSLFQKVLDHPEVLKQVASEVVEDCWNEGTRKVELRYSPSFVSEYSGLSWNDSLQAFHEGINDGLSRFPEMKAGLICIATRDFGVEEVDKTVEFFLNHREKFLALDLAGNESGFQANFSKNPFNPPSERAQILPSMQVKLRALKVSGSYRMAWCSANWTWSQ